MNATTSCGWTAFPLLRLCMASPLLHKQISSKSAHYGGVEAVELLQKSHKYRSKIPLSLVK